MEELKAQIKLKEETKKKEREKERLEGLHNMRGLMQSTNNATDSTKNSLREELLAQIEEKKSKVSL